MQTRPGVPAQPLRTAGRRASPPDVRRRPKAASENRRREATWRNRRAIPPREVRAHSTRASLRSIVCFDRQLILDRLDALGVTGDRDGLIDSSLAVGAAAEVDNAVGVGVDLDVAQA